MIATPSRADVSDKALELAVKTVREHLHMRVGAKGPGGFISSHEILGVLYEELAEYQEEVHLKASPSRKLEELTDIAVAALFGIASINSGATQW